MADPSDTNQANTSAEGPFDAEGRIRAGNQYPAEKRLASTDADPAPIPPNGARRFQPTSITQPLTEPLEPLAPPVFSPSQLPRYQGDQSWPPRRWFALGGIGVLAISIILCLGIGIGMSMSSFSIASGITPTRAQPTTPAPIVTNAVLIPTSISTVGANDLPTRTPAPPTSTPAPPISTPQLPTTTQQPSFTAKPATAVPPTAVPPTATSKPPTATSKPATAVPPTATSKPATAVPPTATRTALPSATARPTSPQTKQPTATRVAVITRRAFSARAGNIQPSEKSGNSGAFQSCVQGRVVDKNSRAISGAALGIGNGERKYETTSNAFGDYQFCGLGASYWQVTLFNIPPFRSELASQPKLTVYLNGANGQVAEVNFLER